MQAVFRIFVCLNPFKNMFDRSGDQPLCPDSFVAPLDSTFSSRSNKRREFGVDEAKALTSSPSMV